MQEELLFGIWLRKQRRTLDLTRRAFAKQVGCAEVTLRHIEAGILKPSKELAGILLERLGVPETERPRWIAFARGLSGFPAESIPSSHKLVTNLPAPLTTFIGREKEQSEVIQLIAKHRLITLTGSGGVGKTRLSIKVGEQVLGNYADGVWLVELASIFDPLLLSRTTAIALGLRDEPQRPVIDMLCDYLRPKKTLIILDNCEHLVDECAYFSNTLLKSCHYLRIVATSREPLKITGEVLYRVPSLELPDLQEALDALRHCESVQLFEERAQLVQFKFSLTQQSASAVAQICNRLDGIPLAIELAAAKIATFSAEQIARQLDESFNLLTDGSRMVLPRHQTLRAAIEWSYDLLSVKEQTLYLRLSVFVNGWTLEAAKAIGAGGLIRGDEVEYLLEHLVHKSIVIVERTQQQSRYHMLEAIRRYAGERLLEYGESGVLRGRHLDYFLNLTETAAPHLVRSEQLEWLDLLNTDYENLRLALEWALSQETAESSLRLCIGLGMFWVFRCYWMEGSKWLVRALAKPAQDHDDSETVLRVRALYQDAELASQLDDFEHMQKSAERSLELAQKVSDQRDIAIARFYVGFAHYRLGDFDGACALMEQSLIEFQELNEPYWEAYTFRFLGIVQVTLGKITFEERVVHKLNLARKTGEKFSLAEALLSRSSQLFYFNRLDEAKKHAEESNALFKLIGSNNNSSGFTFAEIAWLRGNYKEAKAFYMEMQERFALLGEKNVRSAVVANLGILATEEGDFEKAHIYLEEALAIAQDIRNQDFIVRRLIEMGNVYYLEGNIEAFKRNYKEGFLSVKAVDLFTKTYFLLFAVFCVYSLKVESTVQILGVIDTLERESKVPTYPLWKRYYHRAEAHARKTLGNVAFEASFSKGHKMSLDEGLDLALKTVEEI